MSTSVDHLQSVRQLLKKYGHDAILITHLPHVRWISGFSGSHGLVYIDNKHAVVATDQRYKDQVSIEAPDFEAIIGRDLIEILTTKIEPHPQVVAIQTDHLTMDDASDLATHFSEWQTVALGELIDQLVAVKTESEINYLSCAQAITDAVFKEILPLIKPGVTEKDLAAEIVYRQLQHGADGIPEGFWPIVASGPNSALPHHEPSDRKIAQDDVVLLDYGCTVSGYTSDMTRTVVCGRAGDKVKAAYEIVLQAQQAALDTARAGLPASGLDAAARGIIDQAGFGDNFSHSLGHGVGLEIHEWPAIGRRNASPLPAGAVITIEPGVYFAGEFGIRIEDMVVVNDDDCRNLTSSAKNLIEL